MTIEIAAKSLVFHFNKKHLEDPSIPMWVLKFSGQTLYVNHVTCQIPWTTKETPDNTHTKGAIKINKALLTINDSNEAEIRPLEKDDLLRIRQNKLGYKRILVVDNKEEIKEFLSRNVINHGPVRRISGYCGSSYDLIEIRGKEGMTMLSLAFSDSYRVLQPNENYYKAYDDPELLARLEEDEYYDDDDDDDGDDDLDD